VSLTNLDRDLLKRCLDHQPGAWNDFVDQFLGLVFHVIRHTAHLRSVPLGPEDTEDLAAEVLLQIVANDYAILRQFRGSSSLATYLTVITRRICVHELARRAAAREVQPPEARPPERETHIPPGQGLEDLEEVQKLLARLPSRERKVVHLHYLEGRSYEEISARLNIPVNTIGPILSKARKKLRNSKQGSAAKRSNRHKAREKEAKKEREEKPSPARPEPAKTEPEPAKTEPEPEPAKTEAKPEPAKTEAEPEPAKTEAKPEPAKTEAEAEPAKTEAEPESGSNHEDARTESEPDREHARTEPESKNSE
jgi:RNA polymerase sigma-70 factor (ECF subfamily)